VLLPVVFEVFTAVIMKNSIFWDMRACCLLHAGFLFGRLFIPDDGSDMFLQNTADYVVLYPRGWNASCSCLFVTASSISLLPTSQYNLLYADHSGRTV
jgi:hypothetical protein